MSSSLVALALLAILLVDCSMMSGKDIRRGGEKIENAAERNK